MEQRRIWINALRRKDSVDTKNGGVCDKHFKSDDFLQTCVVKTGAERRHKRLKANAVPSIWPDYPLYFAETPEAKSRSQAASSHSRHEREAQKMITLIKEFIAGDTITDYSNLVDKILFDAANNQPSAVLQHDFK